MYHEIKAIAGSRWTLTEDVENEKRQEMKEVYGEVR
jgi:hypothetical protein